MTSYLQTLENTARHIKALKADLPVLVTQARATGASWTAIGAALGMSRQGAVQQFGTVRERAADDAQTTIDEVLEQ